MEVRSDTDGQIVRGQSQERNWLNGDTDVRVVRNENDTSNHLTLDFLLSFHQDESSTGKTDDWRNRVHVVLDLFSNFNMGNIQGFLW